VTHVIDDGIAQSVDFASGTFSYIHHLSVKSQLILADSAADSPMLKIAALYTRGIPLFPTAEVIEILERLTPREK